MEEDRAFQPEAAELLEFERTLKRGVYYALYAKGLLSDQELKALLERLAQRGRKDDLCDSPGPRL